MSFPVFSLRISKWCERISVDAPLKFPQLGSFPLDHKLHLRERFSGRSGEEPGGPARVLGGGGRGEELAQPGERGAAGWRAELARAGDGGDFSQLQWWGGGGGLFTQIVVQVHHGLLLPHIFTLITQQVKINRFL